MQKHETRLMPGFVLDFAKRKRAVFFDLTYYLFADFFST